MFFFFFFKQKTAYEMRISDWSSDVCSSDLRALQGNLRRPRGSECGQDRRSLAVPQWHEPARRPVQQASGARQGRPQLRGKLPEWCVRIRRWQYPHVPQPRSDCPRSEEHTSELQSLMRISYAVFCLKKKKENTASSLVISTTKQQTSKHNIQPTQSM